MGLQLSAGSINRVSLWAPEQEQTDKQCSFVPTLASYKVAKWKWKPHYPPSEMPNTLERTQPPLSFLRETMGKNERDMRDISQWWVKVEVPADCLHHCWEFPWQMMACALLCMRTNQQCTFSQWKVMARNWVLSSCGCVFLMHFRLLPVIGLLDWGGGGSIL